MYYTTSTTTQSQIAAITCCPDTSITLKVEKTQFQKGGSDCGLFAIAFATDLCHGNNPGQLELRSHLLECLRLKKMTPFPSQLHRPGRPQTEHIRVYCSCHLLDDGKEKMAACDRCAEWYHISCENIPKAVFKNSGTFWICSKCVQKYLLVCTIMWPITPCQLKHTKLKKYLSSYDHYTVTQMQLARTILSS